jgi:hypothetical protein
MAASRNSVSVVATRDIPMRADLPFGESCEYGGSNGSDTFLGPGVVVSPRDRTDGVRTSDGRLSDSHAHHCYTDGVRCVLTETRAEASALSYARSRAPAVPRHRKRVGGPGAVPVSDPGACPLPLSALRPAGAPAILQWPRLKFLSLRRASNPRSRLTSHCDTEIRPCKPET